MASLPRLMFSGAVRARHLDLNDSCGTTMKSSYPILYHSEREPMWTFATKPWTKEFLSSAIYQQGAGTQFW